MCVVYSNDLLVFYDPSPTTHTSNPIPTLTLPPPSYSWLTVVARYSAICNNNNKRQCDGSAYRTPWVSESVSQRGGNAYYELVYFSTTALTFLFSGLHYLEVSYFVLNKFKYYSE